MDTIGFVFQVNQFSKNMFSHCNYSHSFWRACGASHYHTRLLAVLAMAKEARLDKPKELAVDNLGQAFESSEDRAIYFPYMTYVLRVIHIPKKGTAKHTGKCWLLYLLDLTAPSLALGSDCLPEPLSLVVLPPPCSSLSCYLLYFFITLIMVQTLPMHVPLAYPSPPLECMLHESRGLAVSCTA